VQVVRIAVVSILPLEELVNDYASDRHQKSPQRFECARSRRWLSSVAVSAIALGAACILLPSESKAVNTASWVGAGTTPTNYNDSTNWNPSGPPGISAIFGSSSYYGTPAAPITNTSNIFINTWDFSTAPQTYYITIAPGTAEFLSASPLAAGIIGSNANITNNAWMEIGSWNPAVGLGGATYSNNDTIYIIGGTAGTAIINNNAASANTISSETLFYEFSPTAVPLLYFQGNNTTVSAGSAIINNFGEVDFDYNTTAATSTINNFHTLFFYGNSTAANATITTENGGRTYFFFDPFYAAGNIPSGGSAKMVVDQGGILDISAMSDGSTCNTNGFSGCTTGTAPYGNPITFTAGSIEGRGDIYLGANTLSVGSLNTNTEFSGVIHNGVSPDINSDLYTPDFGKSISGGVGSLTKVGTGTLILSGDNTYTGLTTISGGTLQIGNPATNNGTTGSVVGNILDNAALVFARSNTYNYSGQITGTGTVTQIGTGTLTLPGINTYTGATNVNAGILEVDGSIASSSLTTVGNGALLMGTGTVGTAQIGSGGTFAPGAMGVPGTSMTVAGNLAFASAAIYLVQLNPSTASFANVSGSAALGGATVNAVYANGSYVAKTYTILTATGGVSGTFGSLVNTNLPAKFTPSLSYDGTHAYLNLALHFTPPPGPNYGSGLNVNQTNVANALVNFFNTSGGIPLVFGTLTPVGLTPASGELATGSQQTTIDAMKLFMGLLTDPFVAGRGDGMAMGGTGATPFAEEEDGIKAYAANGATRSKNERDAYAAIYRKAPVTADPFAQRWSVWAAGFGGSQTTDGNAALGSNTATSRVYGTAVGADYRFSPFTLAGFALAGGGTNFSVANALGTGRSDLFQAGAFIRHTVGPAYLSAALAYGWQDVTTDRTVTIAGVDQLRANFNANAFSGRVEDGYRFVTPWIGGIGITPYAAGQFTTFDLPAYAEQVLSGANTFALAYGSKSVTASRSELGLRSDKSFAMQDAIFTLRGRLAWAHDFNTDRNIAATFQTLPGASFVVNGAAQAHDAALTTASAEIKWLNGWSAAATFEGEFSNVTRLYAGKGVVRYAW
jgi:autotransporter-associated beta strand protein